MPFTDNNLKEDSFGETKTFAIADHSAETMKAKINRDNSQVLRKRAEGQSSSPAAQRGGTQISPGDELSPRTRSASDGDASPFTRTDTGSKAPDEPPVSRGSTSASSLAESMERALAEQADTSPRSAPVQYEPRQGAARPADGTSGTALKTGTPAQTPARQSTARQSTARQTPVRQTATQPHSAERNAPRQSTGSASSARPAEQSRMAKTKMSDFKVSEVSGSVRRQTPKEPEVVYEKSDEGGNTVISVIKAIVYIIFVLVAAVALSVFGISIANDMYAFVKSDEEVHLTIPENTTLEELADILSENEVIRYPRIFKFYALNKHDDMEYVAGEYTVTAMMNYSQLLAEFKEKEVTGTVRITIPEGYTTDDIITLFVDRYGIGTREGFVDVIQNYDFSDYWFVRELEENGVSGNRIYRLDGYLFPDTYDFYLNSSEYTVINRLLRRFSQIFTREYRNQCAELGFTVDEIVTLASMIEKEAAAPSEFFNVSSVFHNRLKIPYVYPRLESDATVVYAIEHDTGERTVDLTYNSPYNTYLYDGLPPGPIANPSASAMLAALMAPETSFYYFVSGNGVTYFSETKEEHDRHIEEIRQAEAALNVWEPDTPQTTGDENP